MLEIIGAIIKGAWDMLSICYPGTGIPIGVIMVGALIIAVSLRILGYVVSAKFSVQGTSKEIRGLNERINKKGSKNS